MKSGFVTILGRPNVGKSTILNAIFNKKIAIVTNKSQTTINSSKFVYNDDDSQIIFTDTPGIHKSIVKLDEEMNKSAFSTAHECDVMVLVADASKKPGLGDEFVLSHTDLSCEHIIVAINKIDLANISEINEIKEFYKSRLPKASIIEMVATDKFNIDQLLSLIKDSLPEGPIYYPTNTNEFGDTIFHIKETIREKILLILRDEIPHCSAVYVQNFEDGKEAVIDATIMVEKESQKPIVIGKSGSMIKKIGMAVRKDLEKYLNKHVIINLTVKVLEDWRNDEKALNKLGYSFKK